MKKLLFIAAILGIAVLSCRTIKPQSNNVAFNVEQMDHSVHACEDFYAYANGTWIKDNPVPETESRWTAFNVLGDETRLKVQKIIEKVALNKNAALGSDEQKIRDLYLSLMDVKSLEKKGISGIQPILDRIDRAQSTSDILDLFGSLTLDRVGTPLGIYIGTDRKNSKVNSVYASQTGLNLPDRDYYLSDENGFKEKRQAYLRHINKMFEIAGLSERPAKGIIALETALAEFSWPRVKMRNPTAMYNVKNVSEWNKTLKNIDVETILNARGIKSVKEIIVGQPSFFEGLDQLVVSMPVETWKSYLKWNTLRSFSRVLTPALENESFNFYSTTLRGVTTMKPRNERVSSRVQGMLGELIGKLFVKEHFDEESKAYMSEMIENLREAYKERIAGLEWMSDETKGKATKKLNAFTYKVGYPDEWKDMSSISISSDDALGNIMNIRKFGYNEMLDKLNKPVNKKEWGMYPQTVNAYYSASNNEIVFPAGILQPPFFSKDFDDAINYGGIGAVIGHEFSHGFDDQGRKYDWDGNLNGWWTPEDSAKFVELSGKLGAQYGSYSPVDGMSVNPDLTMGENIADLGGVTLAYAALEKKIGTSNPPEIDGFTWQQRFFLSWANVWKGNIKEEELKNRLKTDNHSPGEYRVIGPLVNFDPFYEAFGTCEDSKNYKPEKERIKIW